MQPTEGQDVIQMKEIYNESVPEVGFGTFTLEGEKCRKAVEDALNIGYRHIDTAQGYGNENEVGKAIKVSPVDRTDVFLVTKIWHDRLTKDKIPGAVEESLRKLQTEYIDLLLIHWPNKDVSLEETLNALFDLQQEGKVRLVGVSNFTPSLLKKAVDIGPVFCNQVEHHPYLGQEELVKIARENNLLHTAYSPLAQGKVHDDEVLKKIGQKYEKTPEQVTLRWLIQQDNIATIPRSASHKHRMQNFDIYDFKLNDDEMDRIFSLDRGERLIDPSFAPEWEER